MYPIRIRLAIFFALLVCASTYAQNASSSVAPSKPQKAVTAREVFYVALDSSGGGGEKPASAKPKPAVKRKPKPVAQAAQTSSPPPAVEASAATDSTAPETSATGTRGGETLRSADGTSIIKASSTTYPALGLKYSVFQYVDGKRSPADPDQTFHSNEHIQLTMEVSSPGYLYVVSRGASGKWSTLFPGPDAQPEANHLTPGRTYRMPPGETSVISFYEPAGKEQLFLFLSRQPISSSEDLMMQMSGEKDAKSGPSSAHAAEPVMEALNRMQDNDINHLTNVYARDLIVEKASSADPQSTSSAEPTDPKAVSMYVVNPSGNSDSHVVANISFKHE